jgi:hypothetical protein
LGAVALLVLVLAAPAQAAYRDDVLATPGLQSYWRLGDAYRVAADERGGVPGSYGGYYSTYGGALTGDANRSAWLGGKSRIDQAESSRVEMGDVYDFSGVAPFSWEAWIAPYSLGPDMPRIVSKEDPAAGYLLAVSPDGAVFSRFARGSRQSSQTPDPPPLYTWSHLAATYDGARLRLFVNGSLQAEAPSTALLPDRLTPLRLGSRSQDYMHYLGSLDEVAVYDRALTGDEIAGRFRAGRGADFAAPETSFASAPQGTLRVDSATFALRPSDGDPRFQCRLDAGAWAGCAPSPRLTALGEGAHVLRARGIDGAGNVDLTPAEARFTVDTPPDTRVTSGPLADPATDSAVRLGLVSTQEGGSFECRTDGSPWAACSSWRSST